MKLDCEDTTRITIRYHQTRFNQHIRVPIIAGYISQKKRLGFTTGRSDRDSRDISVVFECSLGRKKRKTEKKRREGSKGAEARSGSQRA